MTYHAAFGCGREFVPAVPLMPRSFRVPYVPSDFGDDWCWIPKLPDRIDARRRAVLEAVLALAQVKAMIDEFFRPTAELGAGNDEAAALRNSSSA